MNFRKLLTYLTVGTAAVIPFAGAQNPTILQGNYVSNVFGQSNFVLNPNAQTNVANVTVSSATVTRSTTTPLVATSEFNIAIGTANGTATWATRAFDAGMKGQNCEARFTYRGFAATSKVHIKQSTNVVASLTLTPATDPRIASINFPCGDLSTATTFVVTDTAILAGTNEIGGIYTGLATNMANVAQAEFIGSVRFGTNCTWSITSSTYSSPTDSSCSTTVIGNVAADTVSVTKPSIIVNDTRPGNYYAVWSGGSFQKNQVATYQYCSIRLVDANISIGSYVDPTNFPVIQAFSTSASFQYNSASTKTFQLQMKSSDNVTGCTLNTSTDEAQISVYRFPTSSELVVTPERQNTWGAVEYRSSTQTLFSGSADPTGYSSFNNATWNQPTLLKGKAAVTTTNSGNDLGFSIPNLPVGNYKLEISGSLFAQPGSVTVNDVTVCTYRIFETTTSITVAEQVIQGGRPTSGTNTSNLLNSFQGIYNNTSVATRNFRLEANKTNDVNATNLGTCIANSAALASLDATIISFTITPLDQPSNSALYVQGPVLAAATGAAIPEGYVNEFATRRITDTANRNVSVALGAWYYPWSGTLTLPAGNWNICYRVAAQMFQNRSAVNVTQWYTRIHNQTDDTTIMANLNWPTYDNNTTHVEGSLNTHSGCQPISITSSKVFRVGLLAQPLLGVPTGVILALRGDLILSELYAIRLN